MGLHISTNPFVPEDGDLDRLEPVQYDLIFKDGQLPTTAAAYARLKIGEPTKFPTFQARHVTSAWGEAIITGRIGTLHTIFIEAALCHCLDYREHSNGDLELLVDPAKLRQSLSKAGERCSVKTLNTIADDLLEVKIKSKLFNEDRLGDGKIITDIDRIGTGTQDIKRHNGRLGKLWSIMVSRRYRDFLGNNIKLYYDPDKFSSLKSGVSHAVVRLIVTHKAEPNGGWIIDKILDAVGIDIKDSVALKHNRRYLKNDTDNLLKIGFVIEDGHIKKKKDDQE